MIGLHCKKRLGASVLHGKLRMVLFLHLIWQMLALTFENC